MHLAGAEAVAVLAVLILIVAGLYSTVGHAGGSGYLGAMALLGFAPAVMRPTALLLNLLVASIGSYKWYKAGHFRWSLFWPFALASIPAAYIGGALKLSTTTYRIAVGVVLVYSAVQLFFTARAIAETHRSRPSIPVSLAIGAILGLISGLVGVGGGIFLSPVLLFFGWANPRETAATSSMFILVNSASGLLGGIAGIPNVPLAGFAAWAVAAGIGGWIGSSYGSRVFPTTTLRRFLAVVLVIAGVKLIWG
ncbi:MAG TPA: sulfite exporter TauE/SafE family protein [Gemmatimonadales bacterium]|jgi:hypothetical protein